MIKGIGVDIVEIERIKRALERHDRFCDRVYTPHEQEYCTAQSSPHLHYAVRFAAKEAALKALGTGFRGVKWTDLEVRRDHLGKPYLELGGSVATQAHERGICDIFVSLSFNQHSAVASAIAIGTE